MKIAHIADIHISDSRLEEFEILLKQLADEIKENTPDLIVFSGDLFIHRDRLSPKQVELARKFFKVDLKDFRTLMIVGNHDISMSTNKIDSISAIFESSIYKVYTEVEDYVDIDNYRFHMFPYISKVEMERLGIKDLSEVYTKKFNFDLDEGKKNILIYHGVLQDFNVNENYQASEEAIGIGKEQTIARDLWKKFDGVMAGHLHKHQIIANAVYPGCPFPLTYADSYKTGFVIWNDLVPEFIELPQKYPYITLEIGYLSSLVGDATEEAERKLKRLGGYKNTRVRIKYSIVSSQSGMVDHSQITKKFAEAKEVKIVPEFIEIGKTKSSISMSDFQSNTIYNLIIKHIKRKSYPREVIDIANIIENIIKEKYTIEERDGIHFKLLTIDISNFRCFSKKNKKIDFDSLENVVGVFGKNKSGKSSLIEAIIWSLFGTTIRNKDVNSIIRNGEKEAMVAIEFESHNTRYKIVRSRSTSSLLNFSMLRDDKWVDISGATIKVTQKNIENIIGTFNIFVSTVYSPQNNIDLLIKKRPSERKQIILDCLQIDVLEKRQQEIQEYKKTRRDNYQKEQGRLDTLSDDLTKLLRTNPSESIKKWEEKSSVVTTEIARLNVHIRNLSGRVIEYEDLEEANNKYAREQLEIKERVREIENRIKSKQNEREKLLAAIQDKEYIENRIKEQNKYRALMDECNDLNRQISMKKSEKAALLLEKTKLDNTNQDNLRILNQARKVLSSSLEGYVLLDCPKADCPKNEEILAQKKKITLKIDEIDSKIESENTRYLMAVNALKDKVVAKEKELIDIPYQKNDHMRIMRQLRVLKNKNWDELKRRILNGEDILKNIDELLSTYNQQRIELRVNSNSLTNERAKIAAKIASISNYNDQIRKYKNQLNQNKKIENQCVEKIYACKRDIEAIESLNNKIEESKKNIFDLDKELVFCNKYAEIVSRQGVIFTLVDKAIPMIEKFAQDLLAKTTNGTVSISMKSHKTLQSNRKTDEVMIYMSDAKGKRDVAEASGAETVLISLALRAAMSNLLSLRMGSQVELFIIDEGFGAFDDDNILDVKKLLTLIGERFSKIIFITHVEELKDIAKSIVKIKTNGIVSSFNIIKNEETNGNK